MNEVTESLKSLLQEGAGNMKSNTLSFNHRWTIEDFLGLRRNMSRGESHTSDPFHVGPNNEVTCHLKIYPKNYITVKSEGLGIEVTCYISIGIKVKKNIEDEVLFPGVTLAVVNSEDKCVLQTRLMFSRPVKSGFNETFLFENWIPINVIKKLHSARQIMLSNNSLIISLDGKFIVKTKYPTFEKMFPGFQPTQFTDVVLNVEGVRFNAHKLMLAARSSVFNTMFSTNMVESIENEVNISDINYTAFKKILNFIYCDFCPNIEKDTIQIMYAAEKYDLQTLKTACEKVMCTQVNKKNVYEYLEYAEMFNCSLLKEIGNIVRSAVQG